MSKRIQCPCCHYYTFPTYEDALFEICEVCGWQYDEVMHERPLEIGGANYVSLTDAQKNYIKLGVCDPRFVSCDWIRTPQLEEYPENNVN